MPIFSIDTTDPLQATTTTTTCNCSSLIQFTISQTNLDNSYNNTVYMEYTACGGGTTLTFELFSAGTYVNNYLSNTDWCIDSDGSSLNFYYKDTVATTVNITSDPSLNYTVENGTCSQCYNGSSPVTPGQCDCVLIDVFLSELDTNQEPTNITNTVILNYIDCQGVSHSGYTGGIDLGASAIGNTIYLQNFCVSTGTSSPTLVWYTNNDPNSPNTASNSSIIYGECCGLLAEITTTTSTEPVVTTTTELVTTTTTCGCYEITNNNNYREFFQFYDCNNIDNSWPIGANSTINICSVELINIPPGVTSTLLGDCSVCVTTTCGCWKIENQSASVKGLDYVGCDFAYHNESLQPGDTLYVCSINEPIGPLLTMTPIGDCGDPLCLLSITTTTSTLPVTTTSSSINVTTTIPVVTTTTTDPVFSNCGMSVHVYSLDSNTLCFDITGGTAPYDIYVDSVIIGTTNTDGVHCFAVDCTITHTFNVTDSTPPCEEVLNQFILSNTGFTSTSDWFIDTPGGGGTATISGGYFTYANIQLANFDYAVAAYQSLTSLLAHTPLSITYNYEFTTGQISGLTYANVYMLNPWSSNQYIVNSVSPNTTYTGTFTQNTNQAFTYGYGFVLHESTPVPNINDNIFQLDSFNLEIVSYTYDCTCTVTGNTQAYVTTSTTCYFNTQVYWSGDSLCFNIVGGVAPYEIYIDSILVDTVNTSGVHCYLTDYTITHTYEVSDSTPPCEVTLNQFILNNTGFTSTSDWVISDGGGDAFISGNSFCFTATTYNTYLDSNGLQGYVLPNNVVPISVNYYWEFNTGDITNRNYNNLYLATPFNGSNSFIIGQGTFPGLAPNTFYSGNTTVNTFPQVYPPTPLSGYGFGLGFSLLPNNFFELKDFNLEILSYIYDCTCTITGVTEIPCYCYLIENVNETNSIYSAVDCSGNTYTGTVLSAEFLAICAAHVETLQGYPQLTITLNGECDNNQVCIPSCWTIVNHGSRDCEIYYVDSNGNTQYYTIPSGEIYQTCSLVQPGSTHFVCGQYLETIQEDGLCTGDVCPIVCNCHYIENNNQSNASFIALDCNGDFYTEVVIAGSFATFCGSNVQSSDPLLPLDIIVNGMCDENLNCVAGCWNVINTGTTDCQVYYIDYSGNAQTQSIAQDDPIFQVCSIIEPYGIGKICATFINSTLVGECVQDVCALPTTTTTEPVTTTTTTELVTTTSTSGRLCRYSYMDCSGNTFTGTVVEGEIIYVCSSGAPEMLECYLEINYLGDCANTPNCIVTTTTTIEPSCYCYLIEISSTTSTTAPPNSTTTSSTAGNSTTTSSTAGNSTTTSTAPTTTIAPACSNCKYVDLLISNIDLTDANNYATVVEFQYFDCNGNFQTNYYGYEIGDITDTVCVCLDTTNKLVYYDSQFTEYNATNSTSTPTTNACTSSLIFTGSYSAGPCTYTGIDCNGASFSGIINPGEQIYVCSRTQPQSTECVLDIIDKGLCGGIDCLITTTTSTEQVTTTTSSEMVSTTTTIPCICYIIDYDLGNSIGCSIEYLDCSGNITTEDIGVILSTGTISVCSQNEPVYACAIEDGLNYINIINTGTYCVNGQCVATTTTSSDVTTTTSSDVTTTTSSDVTTTTTIQLTCDCTYLRNDDLTSCTIDYVPCGGGATQSALINIGETIRICADNFNIYDCTIVVRVAGTCSGSQCLPLTFGCYSIENTTQNSCTIDYIDYSNNLVTEIIPAGNTIIRSCVSSIFSDCIIGTEIVITSTGACVGGTCTQG